MPKVEILRLGAKHNLKDIGEVGEIVEVSDSLAKAMCAFAYAKPAVETATAPPAEPVEDPNAETATDDKRETREDDNEPAPAKAVRQWATDNGIDVPARGAIPSDVREKFDAAMAANHDD
jgi:pyruvate/2-oxoglutarate dehydrogenase complex dihydrolipoamide acyltransferase (E2) component